MSSRTHILLIVHTLFGLPHQFGSMCVMAIPGHSLWSIYSINVRCVSIQPLSLREHHFQPRRILCRVDRHALFNHLPSVHIIAGSQVI